MEGVVAWASWRWEGAPSVGLRAQRPECSLPVGSTGSGSSSMLRTWGNFSSDSYVCVPLGWSSSTISYLVYSGYLMIGGLHCCQLTQYTAGT